MKKLLILTAVMSISGCAATTATMFPVEGALSKTPPVKAITVNVDGASGYSGDLSLTMSNGEVCTGKWSAAAGTNTRSSNFKLMSTYSSIYGSSSSFSSGTGKPGTGYMLCDSGRTIDMEYIIGRGGSGFGYAKDNQGNVFKVLF